MNFKKHLTSSLTRDGKRFKQRTCIFAVELQKKSWRNPVYCSWSTNNSSSNQCLQGQERGLFRATQDYRSPLGLELEKTKASPPYFKKIKNKGRGWVIFAPSAKHRIVPKSSFYKGLVRPIAKLIIKAKCKENIKLKKE